MRSSALKAVEKEIRDFSPHVLAIKCDVASESDVRAAVQQVIDKFGRIDILVNNAGIEVDRTGQMGGDLLMNTSLEQYRRVLDTNLIAITIFCAP